MVSSIRSQSIQPTVQTRIQPKKSDSSPKDTVQLGGEQNSGDQNYLDLMKLGKTFKKTPAEKKTAKPDYSVPPSKRGNALGKYVADLKLGGESKKECFRYVKKYLREKMGVKLEKGAAFAAARQLARNPHFREVRGLTREQLKKLPPGAVVVWDCNGLAHRYGHISVADGKGNEFSDHKTKQRTRYGAPYRVFMPLDKPRKVEKRSWLRKFDDKMEFWSKYYTGCKILPGPGAVVPDLYNRSGQTRF